VLANTHVVSMLVLKANKGKGMSKTIIIFGSGRSFGNTRQAVLDIIGDRDIPLEDLSTLDIRPYDYEHRNQDDDFLPLMERIVQYDLIVLATPVYWYSMSSVMKVFVDRFTDLLEIRKDIGHKLRGKKLFIIASFGGGSKGFETPFEETCGYLGIEYLGTCFICKGEESAEISEKNKLEIQKAKKVLA
jgi:putative NADPH-quinone reductase